MRRARESGLPPPPEMVLCKKFLVAVKELTLSYHLGETLLFNIYIYNYHGI